MYKIAIFIIFIACISLYSQNPGTIKLNGEAPALAGTPYSVGRYNDLITQHEIFLINSNVGTDGKFSFEIPNSSTGDYILHIGENSHPLLLEPGHTYNVLVPDSLGQDVYFPNETDTNLLLYQTSVLDYQINYFSIYNYEEIANGKIRQKLKKFMDSMEVKYSYLKDSYFLTYKDYKLAELQADANYKSQKTLFQTYFKGKPVLFEHPQYMAFFNDFYRGFLNQLFNESTTSPLKMAISSGTPVDTLLAAINRSELGNDERLAELICIKGLAEIYYKPGIDKGKIENLVIELQTQTKQTEIKTICTNFLAITGRLKPGKQYINFEGKDVEGNVHSITEYGGKYMLLTFFNPDEAASIREITALKNIYDEFRKDITFVTVCSSCTYSTLNSFVQANKLKWTFLIIDPVVESEYEVVNYPTGFFIDKSGTFVFSPSPLPSSGLSDRIYLYLKAEKRKN